MISFFKTILFLHIAAGTLALISGPWAVLVRKGGWWHRLMGQIFFYAMLVVGFGAIAISFMPGHFTIFFILLGIFSVYLVGTGYRYIYNKAGGSTNILDWLLSLFMSLGIVGMVGYGSLILLDKKPIGAVLIGFGVIAALYVYRDIRHYLKYNAEKNIWLGQHLQRFLAGNIAAFTAFLVVNERIFGFMGMAAWIIPTIIGSYTIAYYSRRYK